MTFEEAVIEQFRTGKIVHQNLPPRGIGELAVEVAGRRVLVTWYPLSVFGYNTRTIEIDGTAYPGEDGAITRAAVERARGLLAERMKELDDLVK